MKPQFASQAIPHSLIAVLVAIVCSGCFGSPPIAADATKRDVDSGGNWSSSSTVGNNRTVGSSSFTRTRFNPTEEQRQRLVVAWNPPRVMYKGQDKDRDDVWIEGENDNHPILRISGKVSLKSDYGNLQPINGGMAICILLARDSNRTVDWSIASTPKGDEAWAAEQESVSETTVTDEQGGFLWELPLDGWLRRVPGETTPFQIGLSIGEKLSDRKAVFKIGAAALPQSIKMAEVPGPPVLTPTMQGINGAPTLDDPYCNPALLVRAVNHLQTMGEADARRSMQEFLKTARRFRAAFRDPANIDTSHEHGIGMIVQALYEPRNGKAMRGPGFGGVPYDDAEAAMWPQMPVAFQDDLPFVAGIVFPSGQFTGPPPDMREHMDWAHKNASFRRRQLWPADDPLLAADRLCARPESRVFLSQPGGLRAVRKQAWTAIAHLVEAPIRPKENPLLLPDIYNIVDLADEATWQQFNTAAAKHRIAWSEINQEYVDLDRPAEERR